MKLTWLNISLLALSVAAADLSSLLEFDPPTLNLKDDALDNKFKCRLKKKLDKPVQVFFQGTGITFDKCSIEIGPNDFQNWKEINLSTVPVFEYRPAVDVTILARAFYDGGKVDHEYKGKRSLAPGGYCSSIGDPHYKTFNSKAVTHMGDGYFHLFQHDFLNIQAAQGNCWGKATCNHGVAVRYGGSIMIMDVRGVGDLKKYKMQSLTPNNDGIVYAAPSQADSTHTLTLPCGTVIKLTIQHNDKDRWIDISLHIAPGYSNHGGICNRIGDNSDDYHCQGGYRAKEKEVDRFMKSWIVTEAELLFKGNYKPISPPAKNPGFICKAPEKPTTVAPPPVNPPLQTYVPPVITTTTLLLPNLQSSTSNYVSSSSNYVSSTTSNPLTSVKPQLTSSSLVSSSKAPSTSDGSYTSTSAGPQSSSSGPQSSSSGPQSSSSGPQSSSSGPQSSSSALTSGNPKSSSTTYGPQTSSNIGSATTNGALTSSPLSGSSTSSIAKSSTSSQVVGVTSTFTSILPTVTSSPVPPPPPKYVEEVTKRCNEIFTVKGCSALVDVNFYIKACISDCQLTGTFALAETSRLSFMAACNTITQYMIHDPDQEISNKAITIQKNCGLGTNECLNNCSGHGVCGRNGCRCNSGWGGIDCSNDLSKLMGYNPDTKKYENNTPAYLFAVDPILAPVIIPKENYPGYDSYVHNSGRLLCKDDIKEDDKVYVSEEKVKANPTTYNVEESDMKSYEAVYPTPGAQGPYGNVASGSILQAIGAGALLPIIAAAL